MDVYTRAHSHPEAANLWLAEAAVEQGRAAFQHRPALPSEDAASRRAARGTRRGSGRWGRGEGEHPKPDPGTPRLSADISWHGHPGTPGHNLLSRCLQNRQRAQEMIGEGGVSTFPLPRGAQAPSIPRLGVPGATWAMAWLHAAPLLAILIPPGSAVLQLELGSDAAGRAAPRPALPASPNQPLSKGWSSKIFSRAPSVYHTVNLGFQQLYDAAGRWEREQNAALLRQTQPACASAPSPACEGGEDRSGGYGWVRAPPRHRPGGLLVPHDGDGSAPVQGRLHFGGTATVQRGETRLRHRLCGNRAATVPWARSPGTLGSARSRVGMRHVGPGKGAPVSIPVLVPIADPPAPGGPLARLQNKRRREETMIAPFARRSDASGEEIGRRHMARRPRARPASPPAHPLVLSHTRVQPRPAP